eukprot:m.453110 g.453110  ORF g.453110 m.453110 type:complete len:103 (+) comp21547_c0_seq8:148-456(+)
MGLVRLAVCIQSIVFHCQGIAQYAGSPFNTANYAGVACRAVGAASYKIGATSIGDSDGGDGTMWQPESALRSHFLIPVATQHIALACAGTGAYPQIHGELSW